jgi:hypothetical protein
MKGPRLDWVVSEAHFVPRNIRHGQMPKPKTLEVRKQESCSWQSDWSFPWANAEECKEFTERDGNKE